MVKLHDTCRGVLSPCRMLLFGHCPSDVFCCSIKTDRWFRARSLLAMLALADGLLLTRNTSSSVKTDAPKHSYTAPHNVKFA